MRMVYLGTMAALLVAGGTFMARGAARNSPGDVRELATKALAEGNFKDAFEKGFAPLALDPDDDPLLVGQDLEQAITCLRNLGVPDHVDHFRDRVIAAHNGNWRLLWTAAKTFEEGDSVGSIVAGTFYRGARRASDGKMVSSEERDRVRALQLMAEAAAVAEQDADRQSAGKFYIAFAEALGSSRSGDGAWRLQYLTDLQTLPDYDERAARYYGGGGNGRGAPVNLDGTPVYHKLPASWKEARTDGERWRWCLHQAGTMSDAAAREAQFTFAQFLHGQFGVQTMAEGGFSGLMGRLADVGPVEKETATRKDESGPFAVKTLTDGETIARLANGIKRFALPAEFNPILILQDLSSKPRSTWGEKGLDLLAQTMEDRQQYDRAADYWTQDIATYGAGENHWKQLRLDQIVGNLARFDAVKTKPAGTEPDLYLVFRNAKKVSFEAAEVKVAKLLEDVKKAIEAKPKQLSWDDLDIENLGYRLVEKNEVQYISKVAAKWEMDLAPREKHFDQRVKVSVPLKSPGAYLVTARVNGGNTTRVILWIADTIIAKKSIEGGAYYFVADAVSGAPIANAGLDLFGYRQQWVNNGQVQIETRSERLQTDADGQATLKVEGAGPQFAWVATAKTPDGRFSYLGFRSVWAPQYYDAEYNQKKVFVITDRPVYRPGQTVKFKMWLATAKYDMEGPSELANRTFAVLTRDPRGQKLMEKSFKTDTYGGLDGEFQLPNDATLGIYALGVDNLGGSSFRVEEYKKPEFEVSVDAPKEPVSLGQKITATVSAKYYFGTNVVNAKVHYKVMRQSHDTRWFPRAPWDWFYEPGYWWFGYDYDWFPGFEKWGMHGPIRIWWGRAQAPPEMVAENEVQIGADGTVKVEIETALAKAIHEDEDHEYTISADVTDESRRTISGSGSVIVAREPFKVYAWVNRGHYQAGDVIASSYSAQTADNKPVANAKGVLKLLKLSYDAAGTPKEDEVEHWDLGTDAEGRAAQQIKAAAAGQYRLSYSVTDAQGHSIEGGYIFVVRGEGFDGRSFRFNDLELVTDKKEYKPGESVRLMINANRPDSTVVLFVRPANGVCLPPKVIRLKGKSAVEEVGVVKKDMPNFFIEAMTVSNAWVYDDLREIVVPPESRVINVAVAPSGEKFKPGEKAKVKFTLTDSAGAPVTGSAVVSVYDKAVEYISGGSNVPEIKGFFWKWRRSHYPATESNAFREGDAIGKSNEVMMQPLGAYGDMLSEKEDLDDAVGTAGPGWGMGRKGGVAKLGAVSFGMTRNRGMMQLASALPASAPLSVADASMAGEGGGGGAGEGSLATPTVRQNFADTALWVGQVQTQADGTAEVELTMPENLTTWKTRVWSMSDGTRVGQGDAEVVTYKNLIVRLQAPRFFVQKDEVVLSANVHNYLKTSKNVKVVLDVGGSGTLALLDAGGASGQGATQTAEIAANSEKRIDWRVKVASPGTAVIKVAALTDEESDAVQMSFPVYVHGMLKTDSFAGSMRPEDQSATLAFAVPSERLAEQSRLEIRYSPSVASAMVDALPYLVDYPYLCTEQTLNRFLPTVITQKVLLSMNLDLKEIERKRSNLNAQEIGDDAARAKDWKRNNPPNPGVGERNPVFDEAVVQDMTREGITRLANMQVGDGGWGWFSGIGEQSWPHTTALVVHGLQVAKANGAQLPAGMLERGQQWLAKYQQEQVAMLRNAPKKVNPYKVHADNLDAFVYMVLSDAAVQDRDMMEFIYRDRNEIAVYGKAMFGLALKTQGENQKLGMILQNISQFVVQDNENQTAYLRLPADNAWWCWYGSDIEAMGYYLKLLSETDGHGPVAARLAKYLINNRKNASYWNSTRDTAICIEALAAFIKASGEDKPNMDLAVAMDGRKVKEVHIDAANFFSFDNKIVLEGADVTAGAHKVEFIKTGTGPLYFNAYVTNFTLEDPIHKAGLEVRVQRKMYKLVEVEQSAKVSGDRGQALDQKVEKYRREEIADGAALKSGDMVEVELEIDSKNDYEYVLFEDMKAAGFEPVDLQSGYNGNDLNAYMELRDNRVSFFARTLSRGKHSVSYRVRAEIPGKFSALPTRASAMYAPELKGNSEENKVKIED